MMVCFVKNDRSKFRFPEQADLFEIKLDVQQPAATLVAGSH
jgi:hypothetical protein